MHWKNWRWSWNSNTLATWCNELTHLKRPWCWERLKAGGEGDDRGWDGWMASLTQWTWVCVNSESWWWTGKPGILHSMGLQRVGRDWVTELTEHLNRCFWAVVLEETLESLLDCKDIKPVNSKRIQSWIFIGRNDAEAEALILWPPDMKDWHWKRPWCWERLKAGEEGDSRG